MKLLKLPFLRRTAAALACALVSAAMPAGAAGPASAKPDVVAANVDPSVNPGDDFFDFANGGWLKANPIPASEARWGIGKAVQEDLYAKQRRISEDAAAKTDAAQGSDEQRIGDFWAAANDEALAEKVGIAPLQPDLQRIDAAKNVQQLLDVAFDMQRIGATAFFDFGIGQDERASDVMAVGLYQGGLGLPNRDYYFGTEAGVVKARNAYAVHVARVLALLGAADADAHARAQAVLKFETALAKASRPLAALRDPYKNYNKMAPAALTKKYTPAIDWKARLGRWGIAPGYVIVGQPEFFAGLHRQLKSAPLPVLRDYLRFHLADAQAAYLSKAFADEDFDFHGRAMRGQQEPRPRWKRVLDSENEALGMALGRIYVKDYFSEAAKRRYVALVEAIRTAYGERIDRLEWMSAETKAKAREKLAAVTPKVGYPDKWKDDSALEIRRDSWVQNMQRARRWAFDDNLHKFGRPVDRSEWEMTPQTYNAYYNPSNNEIVLPAAQLSIPGYADAELDDAVVYGYAAASTIGHEITHGFDDEGRQFDPRGNLHDWWTKQDAEKFQRRADVLAKQFSAIEPIPGIHINGEAGLGENIADYGGILIGLDAFKKTEQYKQGEKIAGYTPLQRFFLGYALGWLFEQREESLRQQLLSDVHSPPHWRVNVPFSNIPEFHEAFGVKPGQPMYREPADRAHIW